MIFRSTRTNLSKVKVSRPIPRQFKRSSLGSKQKCLLPLTPNLPGRDRNQKRENFRSKGEATRVLVGVIYVLQMGNQFVTTVNELVTWHVIVALRCHNNSNLSQPHFSSSNNNNHSSYSHFRLARKPTPRETIIKEVTPNKI